MNGDSRAEGARPFVPRALAEESTRRDNLRVLHVSAAGYGARAKAVAPAVGRCA